MNRNKLLAADILFILIDSFVCGHDLIKVIQYKFCLKPLYRVIYCILIYIQYIEMLAQLI